MNKEEKREYDKIYRLNNKQRLKELNIIWRELNKDSLIIKKKNYRQNNILKIRILDSRNRARKKNLEFNINEKDLQNLINIQKNRCIYSDIEFDNLNKYYSVSIDRKDPLKGYTKDNIQLVCTIVNKMKSDMKEEIFNNLINKIYVKFLETR